MARPFRTKSATRRGVKALRLTSLGAAAVAVLAVVSSGGSAVAAPLVPSGDTGYTLSAQSTGLYINLFGTALTGAFSNSKVTYDSTAPAATAETAATTAEALLLTSGGIDGKASASLPDTAGDTSLTSSAPAGGSPLPLPSSGPPPAACTQGGGGGQSGVGGSLGLGCASAYASIDPSGNAGPQTGGDSKEVDLKLDVSGILNQIYSNGANQLCTGLLQIPTLGSQILGPDCSDALNSTSPTVEVIVGHASTAITTSDTQLQAKVASSSVEVHLFPTDLVGGGTADLLDVYIPSATGTTTYDSATGTWASTCDPELIKISGLAVDGLNAASGGSFPDPLEIPAILGQGADPCSAGSVGNQITSGLSALSQLITIDLASGSTSGTGLTAEGLKVNLLGNQSSAPGGGLTIDTSGIQTSNGPGAGTSPAGGSTTTLAVVATQSGGSSPTSVHTGEWWAGSLPLIALLMAGGAALIGWPRLRRFVPPLARMVSRGGR